MTPGLATDLIRQALYCTLWLCLPLLAVGFIAGIVISLVQTITAIQDSAFSAVPRLVVFLVAFVVALPWMLGKWMTYTVALLGDFSRYAR
jgi:flagellar biosynthetic protein FliQ